MIEENKNITIIIKKKMYNFLKKKALQRSLSENSEWTYAKLIREAVDEKYGAECNADEKV